MRFQTRYKSIKDLKQFDAKEYFVNFTNIFLPWVSDFDNRDAQPEELNALILDHKNRHNINKNEIYKTVTSVERITWYIRFT